MVNDDGFLASNVYVCLFGQKRHPLIGDVRGSGLMLGLELVTDKLSLVPASSETAKVIERSRELGVLLGKGGLYGNCLRIKPPMCITRQDVDYFLEVLDTCFMELK